MKELILRSDGVLLVEDNVQLWSSDDDEAFLEEFDAAPSEADMDDIEQYLIDAGLVKADDEVEFVLEDDETEPEG